MAIPLKIAKNQHKPMPDPINFFPFFNAIRRVEFSRKLGLLELVFGRYLAAKQTCWVTCSNGVVWKLDLTDPGHRWIVFGKYEGGVGIDYATEQLKHGGVFVDSGANIGQWLLYLGGIDNVTTIAFEPVDTQRSWLRESVELQSSWEVQILEYGLGRESATVEIQCDGARSTLNPDWYRDKRLERQQIAIKKLDEVLSDFSIDKVKFWKLDVEGAELDALAGAANYLADHRIENIFFECHPTNYPDICQLLKSFGYQIFDLAGAGLVLKIETEIIQTENLVAIPEVK